ncbi:hypothetical protein MTR67_053785 [Solanum verrucosum]|uniref:Uncharacterized protein n=1 Tax=Solanum verrucosum TaxID=315347 RepID=A0AAF0V873_SOLVR|nr:hypothetical protein MTR67_053785 [Solanum verrucosum]
MSPPHKAAHTHST